MALREARTEAHKLCNLACWDDLPKNADFADDQKAISDDSDTEICSEAAILSHVLVAFRNLHQVFTSFHFHLSPKSCARNFGR